MYKKPQKAWTTGELKRGAELWSQGLMIKEIADALGRPWNSVNKKMIERRDLFPRRQIERGSLGSDAVRTDLPLSRYVNNLVVQEARRRGITKINLLTQVLRAHFVAKKEPVDEEAEAEALKAKRYREPRAEINGSDPLLVELFELAKRDRVSLLDISEATGIPKNMLSYYRTGKNKPPVDRVRAIAKAVGYKLVLERDDDNEDPAAR